MPKSTKIILILAVLIVVGGVSFLVFTKNSGDNGQNVNIAVNDNYNQNVNNSNIKNTYKIFIPEKLNTDGKFQIGYGKEVNGVNLLSQDKDEMKIKTVDFKKTDGEFIETEGFQIVGDKIYFFDFNDKMITWFDFQGNLGKLTFTEVKDLSYSTDFSISTDGKKIAWVESQGEGINVNSKLYVADIDGKDKKVVLEKTFDGEGYFLPIAWSDDNKGVYFSYQIGGRGGYILFGNYDTLDKINIETKTITHIAKEVIKISNDLSLITYKLGNNLVVKNLTTNMESKILTSTDFRCLGNTYFSPDKKYLAYNLARCEFDNEHFVTAIANIDIGEVKILINEADKFYNVKEWISDDVILLSDNNHYFYFNIKDNSLSQL